MTNQEQICAMTRLHASFQATREYLIPLAKLHPMTVGTKSNFRQQSIITAMQDIGITQCQYSLVAKSYDAWRRDETGYYPAEGDSHLYTNDEGHGPEDDLMDQFGCPVEICNPDYPDHPGYPEDHGPCPECGEKRDLEEDAPCGNCNIL